MVRILRQMCPAGKHLSPERVVPAKEAREGLVCLGCLLEDPSTSPEEAERIRAFMRERE
jgi:hypothetical protein